MTDLIKRWQTGDEDAFEDIFEQYKGLVFKTAFLVTGNGHEAEDVLQDVFVNAWNARQSFDPGKGNLGTWLRRITVNRCISKGRKKTVAATSLERALDKGFDPIARQEAHPENLFSGELNGGKLMNLIDSMDDRHRPVLVLKYFNELSYADIAETLGIPVGTVRSRLNKAMSILRRELSREETP